MNVRPLHRYGVGLATALLVLALMSPNSGLAAQDQPSPTPAPASDRSPSYQTTASAGALRLPGEPPAVGDIVAEDSLLAPGMVVGRETCPSGKNIAEFVGEGFIIKIAGRCRPESSQAAMILSTIPGLQIPDGEVRLEAKVANGGDRTTLWIYVREKRDDRKNLYLAVTPGRGWATIYKDNGIGLSVVLAGRPDLLTQYAQDDWNEYAIRLDGPNIWVLLNGKPILSVADSELTEGGVSFGVRRLGDLEDDVEAAVVLRNLRISRLAPAQ